MTYPRTDPHQYRVITLSGWSKAASPALSTSLRCGAHTYRLPAERLVSVPRDDPVQPSIVSHSARPQPVPGAAGNGGSARDPMKPVVIQPGSPSSTSSLVSARPLTPPTHRLPHQHRIEPPQRRCRPVLVVLVARIPNNRPVASASSVGKGPEPTRVRTPWRCPEQSRPPQAHPAPAAAVAATVCWR